MKKLFTMALLMFLAVFTLVGCQGGGDKGNKGNKEAVELLEANLEKMFESYEEAHYPKFSFEYKIKLADGNYETTKISYDESGYFYFYFYTESEDVPTTSESYVWIEDGVLTYTWSTYRKGIDNIPDRRYRTEDYGSNEDALERFEEYIFNNDLNYNDTDATVLKYFDECLGLMSLYCGAYLTNPENKNQFTITKNEEGNMSFRIDEPKEYDGQKENPNYNVVIQNNILVSFESVNHQNHYIATQNFKLATTWSFEAPDLSLYTCFN